MVAGSESAYHSRRVAPEDYAPPVARLWAGSGVVGGSFGRGPADRRWLPALIRGDLDESTAHLTCLIYPGAVPHWRGFVS